MYTKGYCLHTTYIVTYVYIHTLSLDFNLHIQTIFFQKNVSPEDDIEEDILEVEGKRKRDINTPQDPDDIKTYDATLKTNHYESKGSYTLELVGQQRMRRKRSKNPLGLSNAVESSLLSFINQSEETNTTCTLFSLIAL